MTQEKFAHFIRFDKLNVDENQEIVDTTCTFKGAYEHMMITFDIIKLINFVKFINFSYIKISLCMVLKIL